MQIREIMSPSVELISPKTTMRDAATKMRDCDLGALPVGENDRLIGMITDRDIVCRGVAEDRIGEKTSVRDVMSQRIYYCFEDDGVDRAGKIMADHKVRRLPVLNRDKRLVGVVSLADLSRGDGTMAEAAKSAMAGVTEPMAGKSRN